MTKIIQLSGLGCPHPPKGRVNTRIPNNARFLKKGFTLLNHNPATVTEGQMDLLIARDKMVAERDRVASLQGIGSVTAQKYQNTIDVLDDAIYGLSQEDPIGYMAKIEDDILAGEYQLETRVSGIGSVEEIGRIRAFHKVRRREKRASEILREQQTPGITGIGRTKKRLFKTATGNFLKKAATKTQSALKNVKKATQTVTKKVATGVKTAAKKTGEVAKKVAKGAFKVVSAPAKLIIKGILEITLPKAAPFFLYLFINEPSVLSRVPAKVKRKRDKSIKVKKFIVDVIGMKEAHFMGIVRNGIVKQMGASPETILAQKIKGVAGIGFAFAALIPVVIELITKLAQAFKKNKGELPEVGEDDAPSDDDFSDMSETERGTLSTSVRNQTDMPGSSDGSSNDGGTTASDGSGEIQRSASGDYATGGRRGWNTFG